MADTVDIADVAEISSGSRFPKPPEGCVILAVISDTEHVVTRVIATSLSEFQAFPGQRAEIADPEVHPFIGCPVTVGKGWEERYARYLKENAQVTAAPTS